MTQKEREMILKLYDGKPELLPLIHNLAKSKFGQIYIFWLYKNKIFGGKLHSVYIEAGQSPARLKKFILDSLCIVHKPIDLA
jgi:hypothetical protein